MPATATHLLPLLMPRAGLEGLFRAHYDHVYYIADRNQKAVAINPKQKTAVLALQKLTNSKRKPYPPMVLFHICPGALGFLSDAVAICAKVPAGMEWGETYLSYQC